MRTFLILLAGFLLMGLCAGSGIDRIARTDPTIAAAVPNWFANAALRRLGEQALAANRAADTAAYGWHAIDRAPTDAEAVSLFAAGHLASGDAALADRAFRIAGRMGWRVPVTQAYWLNKAIEGGDYDQAAMRLDALLRQQPTLVHSQGLLDAVERNPAARAALIERIDPQTDWLSRYLNEVYVLSPQVLQQRATLLVDAAESGLMLGCERTSHLASAMLGKKLYSEARALWEAQCPEANGPLLGGQGFATLSLQGTDNPFAWQVPGSGDVLLGLVPLASGRGQRLTVDGQPPVSQQFLTKVLLLDGGTYRLSWAAGDGNNRPRDTIRASLVCQGKDPAWLKPQLDQAGKRWTTLIDVPPDCPAQQLTFALAAGGGSLWLEEVEVSPLP